MNSEYESEIQGGEKRYTHQTYGLVAGTLVEYSEKDIRYHKKSWVPRWLMNLVATYDYVDLVDKAFKRAAEKRERELVGNICAPVNGKIDEELARDGGLKRADYPGKLNDVAGGATKGKDAS